MIAVAVAVTRSSGAPTIAGRFEAVQCSVVAGAVFFFAPLVHSALGPGGGTFFPPSGLDRMAAR